MEPAAEKRSKSTVIPYLCPDILLSILSRLPTKPLFRFICASKSWLFHIDKNLIPSRTISSTLLGFFIHRSHYYYNNPPIEYSPHIFWGLEDDTGIDTTLSFLSRHPDTRIIDSCNGLLLCCPRVDDHEVVSLFVCNPVTRRWAALPYLYGTDTIKHDLRLSYVSSSHYKVTRSSIFHQEVYIFSSKRRHQGWMKKKYPGVFPVPSLSNRDRSVFINGALYITDSNHIVRYRLQQHSQTKIMFPSGDIGMPFLGKLGGSICLTNFKHAGAPLQIWKLVENALDSSHDVSWVLEHNIVLEEASYFVVAFHPRAKIILVLSAGGYYCYDLNNRTKVYAGGFQEDVIFRFTPCYKDALYQGRLP